MLGVLVDNFFDLQAEGVFLPVVCRVCTDKSQTDWADLKTISGVVLAIPRHFGEYFLNYTIGNGNLMPKETKKLTPFQIISFISNILVTGLARDRYQLTISV